MFYSMYFGDICNVIHFCFLTHFKRELNLLKARKSFILIVSIKNEADVKTNSLPLCILPTYYVVCSFVYLYFPLLLLHILLYYRQ